jgi:adenylate kinase family enzyme
MNRIVVVGTSGSGKTTFAQQLAERLHMPHIELDALHWGPNWTEDPLEVFLQKIADATTGESWVVDGNYSRARDLLWKRADTVIWLDYAFPIVFFRALKRTLRRVILRERLWNDNRESLRTALFSKDSMLIWVIKTYKRRKRDYPLLFAQYPHITVIRLCSPRAAREWISSQPS